MHASTSIYKCFPLPTGFTNLDLMALVFDHAGQPSHISPESITFHMHRFDPSVVRFLCTMYTHYHALFAATLCSLALSLQNFLSQTLSNDVKCPFLISTLALSLRPFDLTTLIRTPTVLTTVVAWKTWKGRTSGSTDPIHGDKHRDTAGYSIEGSLVFCAYGDLLAPYLFWD